MIFFLQDLIFSLEILNLIYSGTDDQSFILNLYLYFFILLSQSFMF